METQPNNTELFEKWSQLMYAVFGKKAPIFITYTLATAYNHRLVFPYCYGFPLLYLEGGPARGKTTAGRAMASPFHGSDDLLATTGILLEKGPNLHQLERVRLATSRVVLFEEYRAHGPYAVDRWLKSISDGLADARIGAVICSQDGLIDSGLKNRCIVVSMSTDYRQSTSSISDLLLLEHFQRENGMWLAKMEMPFMQHFPQHFDENVAWMSRDYEASGIAVETRNLRNLATLYTVAECWDDAGHYLPFDFSELWKALKATLQTPVASE